MSLKLEAEKELKRIEKVLKNLKVIDSKGEVLFKSVQSYSKDAKYFFEKRKYLTSFEAAVICWAYVDAGLHLKVFKVSEEVSKWFTV